MGPGLREWAQWQGCPPLSPRDTLSLPWRDCPSVSPSRLTTQWSVEDEEEVAREQRQRERERVQQDQDEGGPCPGQPEQEAL